MEKSNFLFKQRVINSWLIILLFIFSVRIFPQDIPFGHLSTEDGLSNNVVNCVLQDRLGFLWFGTDEGLNRFDDYNIKVFRNDLQDTNSISENSIWSLFEDHSGFLWIGTNSGELNRYDYRTDEFMHWNIGSQNIKENRITCIYEDRDGFFWIGTYKDGLYRFDLSTCKLEHWQHQPDNPNSLSHNYVTSILQDSSGKLLIGTYNGLNLFNPETPHKHFIRLYSNPRNPNSLSNNLIWNLSASIFEPNTYWISTLDGITKYNSNTGIFSRIKRQDDNAMQFENSVGTIVQEIIEKQKILWCGTYAGLLQINLSTGKYERFIKGKHNPLGITSNQINYIIKDNSNVIWIATDHGMNFLSPKSMKFNYFNRLPGERNLVNKLKTKSIKAITGLPGGKLWLGSDEGLYFIKNYNKEAVIESYPDLENLDVWSLALGNSHDLWIGTYGQGIKQLDLKTDRIKSWKIKNTLSEFKNPSFNFIKTIFQDSKGMIWIGYWGPGLGRLDPQTGKYQRWKNIKNDPLSLSYNDVWVIFEDSKGRIWIGTNGGGLDLFQDVDGGKFYCWSKEFPLGDKSKSKSSNLIKNNIYSICEATRGKFKSTEEETTLWIGTGGGLNKLTIKNNINSSHEKRYHINFSAEVNCYTVNEGLPDNTIKSILEDGKGNLWIGTDLGISFFNVNFNTFTNFTTSDGLSNNEFNSGSAYKSPEGLMLFGSTGGLDIFNPKKIQLSHYSPPVVLTGFRIFDRSVSVTEESPLKTDIALAKEIILSYNQNVFSFQFSSLDYNSPQSNRYAYQMEGFDKDWIYSGSRRFVTYTNLDPGNYIFRVKGTNSDGVWSKNEALLKMVINPPLWKTSWAYILYFFIIAGSLFAIRRFRINRTKLRDELKMAEFEAKKLQELENLKSRFFANLSHEFRTPLMLIKGPIEHLISKKNKKKPEQNEDIEQLKIVERNSKRLQELIDQLLELSHLEAASIPLKAKQENLITLLCGIVSSFESLAKQKDIKLMFNTCQEKLCAWIDRDKLEKIINNLLSNAFKFTQTGGTISVTVSLNKNTQQSEIKITDTGIGIPQNQLEKIFSRFYQVDDSSNRVFGGSGIGLALVKELVELHKWKISVRSELDKGTEFTLIIPVGDDYLEESEKVYEKIPEVELTVFQEKIRFNENDIELIKIKSTELTNIQGNIKKKSLILIVEDSFDVRKYLSDLLKSSYDLTGAENGEAGLKAADEKMPDLIISDIMMPYMDGIEFCRRIKTNWETSHIPVILLTAKASEESKIEGLETGADDYLTKPFDSKELFIRVKNLLEQRRQLKEKFSKEIKITTENITTTSLDNEFLNRALKIAEKNFANNDFDSETFAKEMFVSRSQLHRKLVAITGLPPGEFLRSFRLKKAAQMILEKRISITQIALEVGFNNPSYFTKAFRQQFNCLPSEFNDRIMS